MLSAPGVGKSAAVEQVAGEAGLEVRSLLGTQIAPEDVSGVPKLIDNRAVFCPPRLLLPGDSEPFCLFLDELPAAPPEVQKAFYSLLLERRIGEQRLPAGTWVVAAGNRSEDRALVRTMSSALVNRVFVIPVRVDSAEWFTWAEHVGIRPDIRGFLRFVPGALQRPVPSDPVPFSTPRSWALLSRDLDLAEAGARLTNDERRALAFGRVTPHDAGLFCALCEEGLGDLKPLPVYLDDPSLLPKTETAMWFLVSRMRNALNCGEIHDIPADNVNAFLSAVGEEYRFALLLDLVPLWAELGATETMLNTLKTVTGLSGRPDA